MTAGNEPRSAEQVIERVICRMQEAVRCLRHRQVIDVTNFFVIIWIWPREAVMCESIPAASIPSPGKPRAFVARWVLEAGHFAVNSVRPLGHLQTIKTCFVTSRRHFRRCSESRVSSTEAVKHCHFGVREEHISTIKDL